MRRECGASITNAPAIEKNSAILATGGYCHRPLARTMTAERPNKAAELPERSSKEVR
jgi:hypothetical protein